MRTLLALAVDLVAELNPGTGHGMVGSQILAAGGTAFFRGRDATHGVELWKSDGTAGGTVIVRDILPGPAETDIEAMAEVNGALVFAANDFELWTSNGTAAGTVRIKDMASISTYASISELNSALGKAFFRMQVGPGSEEVWVTDGTELGTLKLKVGLSDLRFYSEVGGQLFFRAFDPVNGGSLWKTDGTVAGTVLVKSIRPSGSIVIYNATNVNGKLFFQVDDGIHGTELWKSDGTAAGTAMVKDIVPGSVGSTGGANTAANLNGALIFAAENGLWKSDGTEAGTVLLSGVSITSPNSFVNSNGFVYFISGSDGLWKSDGTAAGTVLVKDFQSTPNALKAFGSGVLFFVRDGSSFRRVWYSDGTDAGTVRLTDPIDTDQGYDSGFTTIGSMAFFAGFDLARGVELRAVRNTVSGAPFASGAQLSTVKNTILQITLPAVDPQNDPLTFRVVDQPQHGTISGTAPTVTYTPFAGYVGPDRFTYRANDGTNDSNLASIAITVIDNTPVATDFISQTRESKPKSVLLSATNPKGLPLTFSIISGPAHGTLSGIAPNLIYTPTTGYVGSDIFTYQASDGQSTSNVATVFLTVTKNNVPTANDVLLQMSSFDPMIAQLSGSDADGDQLTYQIVTQPLYGTVVPVGGQLKYVPAATDQVADSFSFQASDGLSVSNVATASILLHQFHVKAFAEDGPQGIADVGNALFASYPPGGSPDLSFTTQAEQPGLFAEQPIIDSTGTLKFTPAPNAQGTTIVTAVLHSGAEGELEDDVELTATFEIEIDQRAPWQNDDFWADGNDDGNLTPQDALLVIDYINGVGTTKAGDGSEGPYYDTSGNNWVTALDALGVINLINAIGIVEDVEQLDPEFGLPSEGSDAAEGEEAAMAAAVRRPPGDVDGLLALLASDLAELGVRKRRG